MGNLLVQVEITPEILSLVSEVSRLLGQFEGYRSGIKTSLKEKIFIRNVYANLALEGSTLSIEEVQRLRRGEPVGAIVSEVEQGNAFIRAYQKSTEFSVNVVKDMLTVFLLMNEGLSLKPEKPLFVGSGQVEQSWNEHIKEAMELLMLLFQYVQEEQLMHPLLKAAVFHFEMAHIQPFVRYSNSVARLWHRLLLTSHHPVFATVPLEFQFKVQQQAYLDALQLENNRDGLQRFVRFSLESVYNALQMLLDRVDAGIKTARDRLAFARLHFGDSQITRKKYMELFKTIGPATASRDLKAGIEAGLLEKRGVKARTRYHFVD